MNAWYQAFQNLPVSPRPLPKFWSMSSAKEVFFFTAVSLLARRPEVRIEEVFWTETSSKEFDLMLSNLALEMVVKTLMICELSPKT